MNLPLPIRKIIQSLEKLPSIGPRQATRLAFYLIAQGQNDIQALAQDLKFLAEIKTCAQCFFVHQNSDNLCDICRDPNRRKDLIAILEKETDLLSIENTKKFSGRYLIVGPISKSGILEEWQKLRLKSVKSFIQKELNGKAEEIILAFSPTSHGDFNISVLIKEFSPLTKKISRLGRGLPTGGEIEFADDETLGEALTRRN